MWLAMPRNLDNTRHTFPSTTGTHASKAMDATAAAVYGPIPSISSNSFTVEGMVPFRFCATYFDPLWSRRARR